MGGRESGMGVRERGWDRREGGIEDREEYEEERSTRKGGKRDWRDRRGEGIGESEA